MGLARLVSRRKGTSLVLLGAAVSLGVVAMTASRFPWRRTRAETPAPERDGGAEAEAEAPEREEARKVPRFKPAPPRDPGAPRWDTPPAAIGEAGGNPPSP